MKRDARRAAVLLSSILVLAACGGGDSSDTPAPPLPPPPETPGVAIPPGQIERAVAEVDAIAERVMAQTGVPGMAVAVVRDGVTVHARGYGVRRVGDEAPVDADTVFQLASVSKSVGATVVAQQVGAGAIRWDTPVVRHLPWFALAQPDVTAQITVGDLYSHRSGLPEHAGDDLELLGYSRHEVLERLRLLPLAPFRVTYEYTNFGLTAGAEAVAAAAGSDWASLSQSVLYGPLGMSSTSSRFADFMARPNRAANHAVQSGAFVPVYQREPDAQSPAGGVSSSARDMARWIALVLGNGTFEGREIVPSAALLPAITPQMVSAPPADAQARAGFYGYGFNVSTQPSGRMMLGHSGAFSAGAGTSFALLPSVGVGIVVLTNAAPVGAAEAVSMEFIDRVQFGTSTRDWMAALRENMAPMVRPWGRYAGQTPPADAQPARTLTAYEGTYTQAYFGDARVELRGEQLVLVLGPDAVTYPLRHWDGDTFVFDLAPPPGLAVGDTEPEGSVSAATFTPGPSGLAATLELEYFHAGGAFVRR